MKISDSVLREIINELLTFIIIFVCIIVRICNYKDTDCSWIWIINYVGMAIAFLNLFITKTISFYNYKNKAYKPFLGLTIVILILLAILIIFVGKLQSSDLSNVTNDIITLLALFFSLSPRVWNGILNIISQVIK